AVSSAITVNTAAASRLTIATQPSATASVAVPFAPQPLIRVEDGFGNLRTSDNSTAVTAGRAAGRGTLQGRTDLYALRGLVAVASTDPNATMPTNAALVAGTKNFSVTLNRAGTTTLTAQYLTDGAKTANTTSPITVNAGAFAKLQLIVPGETPSPGSPTGKTGTPSAQTAGSLVTVTVNAVEIGRAHV